MYFVCTFYAMPTIIAALVMLEKDCDLAMSTKELMQTASYRKKWAHFILHMTRVLSHSNAGNDKYAVNSITITTQLCMSTKCLLLLVHDVLSCYLPWSRCHGIVTNHYEVNGISLNAGSFVRSALIHL